MIRYQNPLAKKGLFIRSSRGDATISVILAIILISGVFLTGGVLPHMEDETLKKDTTAVVQGIKSEDESGNSFIASNTTGSDTKRSIQMKQLVLITATPTPSVTPTPSPSPTTTPASTTTGGEWSISYLQTGCVADSNTIAFGLLQVKGPKSGTIKINVNSTPPRDVINVGFASPEKVYSIVLSSVDGFTSNSWTVKVDVDDVEIAEKVMPKIYC